MSTILLLGGYGMLGTDMYDVLSGPGSNHEVIRFSSADLDITDQDALHEAFAKHRPQWIINCAAYTAVDLAEDEPDKALAINASAVENIAQEAKAINAKVIHFSTDYVFDGEKVGGYQEGDPKHPLGSYGRSKSLGEDLLFQSHPEGAYVIRTAWLYGHHGKNFIKTMLRLSSERPEIRVVADQTGCPTWTRHLAQAIRDRFILPIAQNDDRGSLSTDYRLEPARQSLGEGGTTDVPPGIYHLVNSGSCTWYDFAVEIMREANLPTKVTPITTDQYPTKAVRPMSSILLNTKLPSLPDWKEALKGYFLEASNPRP